VHTLPAVKHRRHESPPSGAGQGGTKPNRIASSPLALVTLALVVGFGACGSSGPSSAARAKQQAFLGQVHVNLPTINKLRSDSQLIGLGHAACTLFAAGASYQDLADHMSLQDNNLPTSVLGTVITSAGEHLCPKYSSRVS
jgi:hypothetical protein